MHRVLLIQEILLRIFRYCEEKSFHGSRYKGDLVALATTCRTFKEPALDVIWKELSDLSILARCLPGACCRSTRSGYYSFSRPLSESEWNTLRGYARRVRSINQHAEYLDESVVPTLASCTDPLFPDLRSLSCPYFAMLPVVHIAVPSLTSLSLGFESDTDEPPPTEYHLETLGERCPNVRRFRVFSEPPGPLDAAISRQLCRWTKLRTVGCPKVTLSIDAILCLPSISTLKALSFTLSADSDPTHLGSVVVFSNLAKLEINSASLESVTSLFSCIRLPKIKGLKISVTKYAPKRDLSAYWTAAQKACTSGALTRLAHFISDDDIESCDEESPQWLTLDDLLPCKDFGNLRRIDINVPWSVSLTDADLLDLVSTSPQLRNLAINVDYGWNMDHHFSGITLSGLVQLLRQCPSLSGMSLAIDSETFAEIPHGMDVSFPPRGTVLLDLLDSDVALASVAPLTKVFDALGLDSSALIDRSFDAM